MSHSDGMMQALMLTAIHELQLLEVPLPAIAQPDDVLLKVKSVGVCGSDLHGYTGHSGRRIPPLIMGHEVSGEVVAVGSGVEELAPGDRVAAQPVKFCGRCSQCLNGQRSTCENRRVMGMNAAGAYAEYVVWPAGNLYRLPDNLTDEAGALAEPTAVALHAVALAHIRPGDSAFIVGAGPIGLLTLAILRRTGVTAVAVSDTGDVRLERAREMGAQFTINPATQNPREIVASFTDGRGVDLAFEAVGLSATAQQTLDVTRSNGTVIWIGNNQRMIEVDMQAIVTRELTVRGSYGMSDGEFKRALKLLAEGHIPAQQLINRRAALAEGAALFDQLLAAPETIKCVINF